MKLNHRSYIKKSFWRFLTPLLGTLVIILLFGLPNNSYAQNGVLLSDLGIELTLTDPQNYTFILPTQLEPILVVQIIPNNSTDSKLDKVEIAALHLPGKTLLEIEEKENELFSYEKNILSQKIIYINGHEANYKQYSINDFYYINEVKLIHNGVYYVISSRNTKDATALFNEVLLGISFTRTNRIPANEQSIFSEIEYLPMETKGFPDLKFPFNGTKRITCAYNIDDPICHPISKYALDFNLYQETVRAANSGYATQHVGSCEGTYIKIVDGSDSRYYTYYGHLKSVTKTGTVKQGDNIAISGDTGTCSDGYHLHFSLNLSGTNIKPEPMCGETGFLRYQDHTDCWIDDITPPVSTISLSGTIGENGWYRSNVVATISATDNLSGVNYSQYNLNGAGWVNYASPVTISVNGSNTLQYRSVDKAGNWEVAKSISFKIDTVIPSNPTSASSGCSALSDIWQNICSNPNFTWTGASDVTSGVGGYQYYWGTTATGTSTNATVTAGYDPPAVSDGIYYLRVRTKDNAGNWSGWITLFTLKYEGTPPTGFIYVENDWEIINRTLVSVYTEANDNLSGVDQYRIRNSGEIWTDWMPYGNTSLWLLPQITDKTYVVEAEFKDKAGNISETKNDGIYLDIYPNRPKSNSYLLRKSTFGMAGIKASSTNYEMEGTLAQQSVVGTAESENYQVSLGFWNKFFQMIIEYFNIYLPILTK